MIVYFKLIILIESLGYIWIFGIFDPSALIWFNFSVFYLGISVFVSSWNKITVINFLGQLFGWILFIHSGWKFWMVLSFFLVHMFWSGVYWTGKRPIGKSGYPGKNIWPIYIFRNGWILFCPEETNNMKSNKLSLARQQRIWNLYQKKWQTNKHQLTN